MKTPGLSREEVARWADLSAIPEVLREMAIDGLLARDPFGFLGRADNMRGLEIVWRNRDLLTSLGFFEAALLRAYEMVRVNTSHFPFARLMALFRLADRRRLREAGSPQPGPGPFTLYRGVAGVGRARRIRGLSWTSDEKVARGFANRAALMGGASPAVLRAVVPTRDVLAFLTDREESEFLVMLSPKVKVERVTPAADEDGRS